FRVALLLSTGAPSAGGKSARAIHRPRVYSVEEMEKLLTVGCPHPKHRAFLMTVYGAGLRLNEACHLKFCHIDSARMQLRVEQGQRAKGSLHAALVEAAAGVALVLEDLPACGLAFPGCPQPATADSGWHGGQDFLERRAAGRLAQ